MDKKMNCNKDTNCCNGKKSEKGMNRTEFAQEYSLETGRQNCNKQMPCKSKKSK